MVAAAARLRAVSSRELVNALEKAGFQRCPLGASGHVRLIHPDGRRTTVPFHGSKDIGLGLLRKILRDVDMSSDDLERLL